MSRKGEYARGGDSVVTSDRVKEKGHRGHRGHRVRTRAGGTDRDQAIDCLCCMSLNCLKINCSLVQLWKAGPVSSVGGAGSAQGHIWQCID